MADEKTFNSKELAAAVGMKPKALRRHLRRMEKYADGVYTNYAFNKKDFDRLVKMLTKPVKEGKKEA